MPFLPGLSMVFAGDLLQLLPNPGIVRFVDAFLRPRNVYRMGGSAGGSEIHLPASVSGQTRLRPVGCWMRNLPSGPSLPRFVRF